MKNFSTIFEETDYWNCKYISKEEIIKLCNKALENTHITPSIISDEISRYKDLDHLYNAYESGKITNYIKFEKNLILLLKNNNYLNEILEEVFNTIYDLIQDCE